MLHLLGTSASVWNAEICTTAGSADLSVPGSGGWCWDVVRHVFQLSVFSHACTCSVAHASCGKPGNVSLCCAAQKMYLRCIGYSATTQASTEPRGPALPVLQLSSSTAQTNRLRRKARTLNARAHDPQFTLAGRQPALKPGSARAAYTTPTQLSTQISARATLPRWSPLTALTAHR